MGMRIVLRERQLNAKKLRSVQKRWPNVSPVKRKSAFAERRKSKSIYARRRTVYAKRRSCASLRRLPIARQKKSELQTKRLSGKPAKNLRNERKWKQIVRNNPNWKQIVLLKR